MQNIGKLSNLQKKLLTLQNLCMTYAMGERIMKTSSFTQFSCILSASGKSCHGQKGKWVIFCSEIKGKKSN